MPERKNLCFLKEIKKKPKKNSKVHINAILMQKDYLIQIHELLETVSPKQ